MKNNWRSEDFEDCLEKVTYTNKVQRKDFLKSGKFPIISQEEDFINGYWNNEKDVFRNKVPIIIFGDHTRVLKYIDFDFALGADGVKILQPKKFLNSKFFHYFLQSVDVKSLGYARHYRLLKEIRVSFPIIDEQKRIVGILDEVFEGVAKAKENVEGNLRNVSEVFEAYLQSVFANRGKGWEENSLGNICEIYQPRTISTKEMKHDGQYVVYGANGVIGKYDKYNHEESQLLITCRGATCGSVNISTPKAWINGNAMVVRPKDESLNREFLTYFFRNGSEISKTITGAAQPQITRTTLAPLKIGFPKSLSEQKSIVTKLDALSTETKKLEAVYKEKLNHLEELKKSILKKAFNGEL